MENKFYISNKVPFLRCVDSRGIDIGKIGFQKYGVNEAIQEMNQFISNQLISGNPDNYIHCIWFCITTVDLRSYEILDEFFEKLKNNLPVIIVGTKSISNAFNENFTNYLEQRSYQYEFIPVLAKKIDEKEPFGLEELKLKSLELIMGGHEN